MGQAKLHEDMLPRQAEMTQLPWGNTDDHISKRVYKVTRSGLNEFGSVSLSVEQVWTDGDMDHTKSPMPDTFDLDLFEGTVLMFVGDVAKNGIMYLCSVVVGVAGTWKMGMKAQVSAMMTSQASIGSWLEQTLSKQTIWNIPTETGATDLRSNVTKVVNVRPLPVPNQFNPTARTIIGSGDALSNAAADMAMSMMPPNPALADMGLILEGKRVCVTGAIPLAKRTIVWDYMAEVGIARNDNLRNDTDFLVVAPSATPGASNKTTQAKNRGIKVVEWQTFWRVLSAMRFTAGKIDAFMFAESLKQIGVHKDQIKIQTSESARHVTIYTDKHQTHRLVSYSHSDPAPRQVRVSMATSPKVVGTPPPKPRPKRVAEPTGPKIRVKADMADSAEHELEGVAQEIYDELKDMDWNTARIAALVHFHALLPDDDQELIIKRLGDKS